MSVAHTCLLLFVMYCGGACLIGTLIDQWAYRYSPPREINWLGFLLGVLILIGTVAWIGSMIFTITTFVANHR